jgi:hypothetical protein
MTADALKSCCVSLWHRAKESWRATLNLLDFTRLFYITLCATIGGYHPLVGKSLT